MELRDRIIEQATRMFSEFGIKSVRMDDIATQCGISKRTLYENFTDREDLIRQSLRYNMSKNEKCIQERIRDAENVLDELCIIFGYGSGIREGNRIVMKDLIKFYPAIFNDFVNTHHNHIMDQNAERFRRGQKEGLILNEVDPEFIARTLTMYFYGIKRDFEVADWEAGSEDNLLNPRSFAFAMMLFFRGVTTEKGRKYMDERMFGGTE